MLGQGWVTKSGLGLVLGVALVGCRARPPAAPEPQRAPIGVVGCSDGQREAFVDAERYPDIAGCAATWHGSLSLRAPPTERPCGDDLVTCIVPADACAGGWHVCGTDGSHRDLTWRIDATACDNAGPGRFHAAISHGHADKGCPGPPADDATFDCRASGLGAEPVCCGAHCEAGLCVDGVWPERTRIGRQQGQACGAATAEPHGGVLCCRDGAPWRDGSPRAAVVDGTDEEPPPPPASAEERLGRRIAELRRAEGMRQEALAQRAEIDLATLDALERGTAVLGPSALERIAHALGRSLPQLFEAPPDSWDRRQALDALARQLAGHSVEDIERVRRAAEELLGSGAEARP